MNARAGFAQASTKPFPDSHTIAYKAAHILFKDGAMLRSELIAKIAASSKNSNVSMTLDTAILNGWLTEGARGAIDISDVTLNHLSGCEPTAAPEPYIGIPAEPRHFDVLNRPPISKKYRLNPSGWRADIPEWSQRDHQSFRSA